MEKKTNQVVIEKEIRKGKFEWFWYTLRKERNKICYDHEVFKWNPARKLQRGKPETT